MPPLPTLPVIHDNMGVKRSWTFPAIALLLLFVSANLLTAATPQPGAAHPRLRRHPVVALTFDDLPAAGGLPEGQTRTAILTRLSGELKPRKLRGSYGFVNAVDLDDDPDAQQALRIWLTSGMNIGNHTWSHPTLTDVTAQKFINNIARNEPALRQYAGNRDWHWFRYPDLEEGETLEKRDTVRAWLRQHGYRIAEVTLTIQDDDWSDPYNRCLARNDQAAIAWLEQSYLANAAEFIRLGREEERIAFGHEIPNVLLLHATDFTSLMLPSLLRLLHEEGFRFAPLAKVVRDPAYSLDPHAGLAGGGPFPNLFLDARHLRYPAFTPEPVQALQAICQ